MKSPFQKTSAGAGEQDERRAGEGAAPEQEGRASDDRGHTPLIGRSACGLSLSARHVRARARVDLHPVPDVHEQRDLDVAPVSSVAGLLPPPDAVSPRTPGSVCVTSSSTLADSCTSAGLSSMCSTSTVSLGLIHFSVSLTLSSGMASRRRRPA